MTSLYAPEHLDGSFAPEHEVVPVHEIPHNPYELVTRLNPAAGFLPR